MEYFWIVLASLGAGIGTGLAGLSAATVMVPIFIVLCPSFQGMNGAYSATAIALASDVLGSLVTTITYIKNKNINLKRGWIMLVCILFMCTLGSYCAWLVGNVVLGSFTLFLTLFIGIRFLVKPDSSHKEFKEAKNELDLKGIIISLFFGLTIGFGTGFVGTGGGMMMLIVFTFFLGYGLKEAVGTSTFIMTFTALIASVSHIFINPAIVLERWDALIISIVVVTLSSLLSARFANRVKSRTVGLITGGVLTILGGAMLCLNFWPQLSQIKVIPEIVHSFAVFFKYIIPCVIVLLLVYKFAHVPRFVFRKLLHMVAFTCITIVILRSYSSLSAIIFSLIIAFVVYPVLKLLEKEPWYSSLFVEKRPGEIKNSLLMLFSMFSFLTFISWTIFKEKEIGATAILMWGVGDASAALIGIPFGKHKVKLKYLDGKKSIEGSVAFLLSSLIVGFFFLGYCRIMPLWKVILSAIIGGAVGSATELFTKSEYDTVTVPIAILLTLLFIFWIF